MNIHGRQKVSRAELMEEGNVSDEAVCMLWLLRESSCFLRSIFKRRTKIHNFQNQMSLYLNSLLAKTLLSISIHNALDSAALGFFSKKKEIFSTELGTGVLFQVPFMERSSAVFIRLKNCIVMPKSDWKASSPGWKKTETKCM